MVKGQSFKEFQKIEVLSIEQWLRTKSGKNVTVCTADDFIFLVDRTETGAAKEIYFLEPGKVIENYAEELG